VGIGEAVTRNEKIAAFLAAGGSLVAAAAWWSGRDEDGGIVDTALDALALLTSSEADRMGKLEPTTREKLGELIGALADDGLRVFVGQTLRTAAAEKANVDAGKTAAGLVYSWHELGRAVDLYPVDPDTGKPDYAGRRVDLFAQMHAKAKLLGWRGIAFQADGVTKRTITNSKGKPVWDGGHLEWRAPHATIVAAVAAEGAAYGIA
jgi:hypothetical protein